MIDVTPTASPPQTRWPRGSRTFLAAAFGAACFVLAYPPIDLAFPALFGLVPALVLARGRRFRSRLWIGWLIGFGYQLICFRWIPFTVGELTGLPWAAGFGMWVLYAAWHGLSVGVGLALSEPSRRWAASVRPRAGPIAQAITLVAVEQVWPALFDLSYGHTFWTVAPVISIAALGGTAAVALVVVLTNTLVADAIATKRRHPSLPGAAVVASLLAFGVAWVVHLDATPPERTLRIALVQPNYLLAEKKQAARGSTMQRLAFRSRLLDRFVAQLEALPPDTYDLVIASEGAFPLRWELGPELEVIGRRPDPHTATERVADAIARGSHAPTIIGGIRRGPDGRPRNTTVHFAADGAVVAAYDKQTLMPFGEYLPGRDLFPGLARAVPGIANFAAGERPCGFDVAGLRVACGICYETLIAEKTWADLGDAELLINLTIDTWFGTTTAPHFHLTGHATRAAELGVPLVRAALTGFTAHVGPDGQVVARLPLDKPGVLDASVPIRPVTTPYRLWGPAFMWLVVALAGLTLVAAFRRRRELSGAAGVSEDARPDVDALDRVTRHP